MSIIINFFQLTSFFQLTIVNSIFVKINDLIKFLNWRTSGYNSI